MGKGNVAKAKIARERKLKAAAKAGNAGGGKAGMKARMGSGQGHQCNICKVRGHAARCLCDPDWLQCMVTWVLCGVGSLRSARSARSNLVLSWIPTASASTTS